MLDPVALDATVDRLYRAARALCGSREEAEDLVQETYVRVLSRPRFLRRDESLPYLLKTLRNAFLEQRRRESRRPRAGTPPEGWEAGDERSDARPEEALATREVFEAIAGLDGDFRDVLVAVDVAGLTYAETASAFRIPIGTVMSRLYRARQQVVRRVEGAA